MQALLTKDETIKPIVSYLAANLQDALPVNRALLLLLGDRPSPVVAKQIINLIRISVESSSSFIRKFELISGWNVLKTVSPMCWDSEVNEAAFDLLLRPYNDKGDCDGNVVVCPQTVATILSAPHSGLNIVARNCSEKEGSVPGTFATEATMELLLFVNAYKDFVAKVSGSPAFNEYTVCILEKLAYLGLALALDSAVAGAQKREILGTQSAQIVLNPAAELARIDPNLVADTRPVRQRFARFSLQIGERTVMKITTRIVEWRKTIQVSEKKRLRKNILDLREKFRVFMSGLIGLHQNVACGMTMRRFIGDLMKQKALIGYDGTCRPKNTMQRTEGQLQAIHGVQIPESEVSSAIVQTEVLPKVRHELEPGDVIEAVQTVVRIYGVDSSHGRLIIERTHLYMLNGLVEGEDGGSH
ncbi:Beige protein-like 1 [Stygiomarasmius scandens]|uniref:Beige protein-like 1 n=1 Tax=Marasmiellus scandens TaxID=2682957 RepID=A0ABR1IMX2_9AGAR